MRRCGGATQTRKTSRLTFELLHIKPNSGHYVGVLLLLRLEVVQQGALPAVVQANHWKQVKILPRIVKII